MKNINLGVYPSLIHDDEDNNGKLIKYKYSYDGSKIASLIKYEFKSADKTIEK